MGHGVPLIPYLHSGEDIFFFAFLFIRVNGMFIMSPLLDQKTISTPIKIFLIFFTTLLFAGVLYPEYRGVHAKYILPASIKTDFLALPTALVAIKELATGYCIGLCFSFLTEAILLGASIIANATGLSFANSVDPMSGSSQTILTQLFTTLTCLYLLSLDLHHEYFLVLRNSFAALPIGQYIMTEDTLDYFVKGSGHVFIHGLQLSAFSLAILILVTIALGFMSKVMPEMNIFAMAFPVKMLIGFYALFMSVGFLPVVVQRAFIEYENLANRIIALVQQQ